MKLTHALIEGGQTWAHRMRMVRQVLKITTVFSFALGLGVLIVLSSTIPKSHFQDVFQYTLDAIQIKKSNPSILLSCKKFQILFLSKVQIALITSLLSYLAIAIYFILRGKRSKKKIHLSGRKKTGATTLALKLKLQRQASFLQLETLPLVKDSETQHLLVTGGTGSGKTNCFLHILPQIRRHNQRAVIVDTTGIFVEKFFDEKRDILLNPFDPRSKTWHPWAECTKSYDYKALAESFIPQSFHDEDNYWRTAARTFFTALLQKTSDSKKNSTLSEWVLYRPLVDVCAFLASTKAASVIDIHSEKTAASVRSVATAYLECLDALQDTTYPFSITEWMHQKANTGWLFLACTPDQRAEINPLLSCWFSVANRALLQMPPSFDRRIWFVLDELSSLNRLRNLEQFIVESRKYGGCGLLALQSPAQMEAIYGEKISKIIIGNCGTKIAFSEQDPEIAHRISRFFGEREILQYQEGISYGANEIRDGVNITANHRQLPTVSPTDIQTLEKNQAFVKLIGNYPITKIQFSIKKL